MDNASSTDIVAGLTQAAQDWLGGGGPDQGTTTVPATIQATLVSNLTPPIDLSGQGQGGLGGRLLAWIQPTITGTLPIVGPVNVAPYGAANPAVGTLVFYTLLGLAAYGAYKLFR